MADPMGTVYQEYGPLKREAIPQDLTGLTVLDIGGYDGRFGAVCLERCASRVVVLDNGEWQLYYGGNWPIPQHFTGLEYVEADFMQWAEPFDIVLFYNVLYHCADWEGALPKLRRLVKGELCLSTYWAEGTDKWVGYSEDGRRRATPTLHGLQKALENAGFMEPSFYEVKDAHVVIRCS